MIIALVGYMGSGKSTIGKKLAADLGLTFSDLDTFIEEHLGKTVSEIFQQHGEVYFRKKEHELLKEWLSSNEDGVLALGGGTPCYAGNMDLIRQYTPNVFYLRLTVPSLVARLKEEKMQRPIIAGLSEEALPEFIGNHLFERSQFYNQAAHTLVCDQKTPEQITAEIKALI
jgi:shikimate kinase